MKRTVCVIGAFLATAAFAAGEKIITGCIDQPFSREPICAPPLGSIVQPQIGEPVCGAGQCITESIGDPVCARLPGGYVRRMAFGRPVCSGGCEPPRASLCHTLKN